MFTERCLGRAEGNKGNNSWQGFFFKKRRRISWFNTSKSVGFRCIVTMTALVFFLGFSSPLPLACGQRAEKRSRVSYMVDLYLLKRSKVPSGPPSPILTSHTIPRSTALSI